MREEVPEEPKKRRGSAALDAQQVAFLEEVVLGDTSPTSTAAGGSDGVDGGVPALRSVLGRSGFSARLPFVDAPLSAVAPLQRHSFSTADFLRRVPNPTPEQISAAEAEKDLLRGIVRTGSGVILGHVGTETGWSQGNKWKRVQMGKDQLILAKRWHTGHDRCHKRLWLSCQSGHTALAGLVFRGAGGLSRAQTVQVLANSLALEIVVLCMQYSESAEDISINLVSTFVAGLFAALVRA